MKNKIIKIMQLIFSLLIMLHIFIMPATAKENPERVVRVGFYLYDGLNNLDYNGDLSGYNYEYLMHLARYNNWKYEFVGFDQTWDQNLQALKNNDLDLICSVAKEPRRTQNFLLSDAEIGHYRFIISTRSDNDQMIANDLNSLDNKVYGVLNNSICTDSFIEFAQENNLQYELVKVNHLNEIAELKRLLALGKIDAIVSKDTRLFTNEKKLYNIGSGKYYIALNLENQELMKELNTSMELLAQNEPYLKEELSLKYFDYNDLSFPSFTQSELDYIAQSTKINVGFLADNYPFSFLNDNNIYAGIYIEELNWISEYSNLKFNLVPLTLDQLQDTNYLNEKNITLLMGYEHTNNQANQSGWELSDPILKYHLVSIFYDSTTINNIGYLKSESIAKELIQKQYPKARVFEYANMEQCLKAFKNRSIDLVCSDEYTAQLILNQTYVKNISIRLDNHQTHNFSIAIARDSNKDLFSIINKTNNYVLAIHNSEIAKKYVYDIQNVKTLADYWIIYKEIVIIVIVIIGFFSGLTIILVAKSNHNLRSASVAKSKFLSKISHDMRTPLTAIVSFADFGIKENHNQTDVGYFKHIKNSSNYLLSLINDILDVQKMENKSLILENKVIDLVNVFNEIEDIISISAKKKNIEFITDYQIKTQNVLADEKKIKQLCINLLNNAIKYTQDYGMVIFKVKTIRLDKDNTKLLIEIIDNGVGMSEEYQKEMFLPFSSEKNILSIKEGGSGLGLAIVKKIIDAFNGTIECSSQLTKGTTFKIAIPLQIARIKPLVQEPLQEQKNLENLRVLICDDVLLNIKIAKKILLDYNCQVDFCLSGEQAIEKLKKNTYDVVFMDIRMPNLDGYETTKLIREFNKRIVIIALSANAYAEDIEKCINVGMNSHLAKPIDRNKMYNLLRTLVK